MTQTVRLFAVSVTSAMGLAVGGDGLRTVQQQQRTAASRVTCAAQSAPTFVPTTPAVPTVTGSRFAEFIGHFQGHFDNVAQVRSEREAGLFPREGGGHEHIHCHLQPISFGEGERRAIVLATYYFDGQPDNRFRTRVYSLREQLADRDFGDCIEMQIFRLRPGREKEIAAAGASAVQWGSRDVCESLRVPECEVYWQHVGGRFEGCMRTESITVQSPVLGKPVVVRDDVTLSRDYLWCNDRGHDAEGNYVYGNIHGVPYKMDRVQWAQCPSLDLQGRSSVNPYSKG